MQLEINGERRELASELSLQELVQILNLKPEQIAIELNQVVVRRAEWASTRLKEGDRIEIVHFVGGGSRQEQPKHVARAGNNKRPQMNTDNTDKKKN